MKYMLLLYGDESQDENATEEEMNALFAEYGVYTEALNEAGAFVAGEALQPTATATTVAVRDDNAVTTHGPFAETKEQLGGFYIIDCENLDAALAWAAKCPAAKDGRVEVRPIVVWD